MGGAVERDRENPVGTGSQAMIGCAFRDRHSRVERFAFLGVISLALLLGDTSLSAATPNVGTLLGKMQAALEPPRPSVRKVTVTISAQDGEASHWVAGEAQKPFKDGSRILIAILAPADQKGAAYLLHHLDNQLDVEQDVYVPAVRRVRKIRRVEGFRAFLESDFTLADLGFVNLRPTRRLVDTEDRAGVRAYKIQEVPTIPEAKSYYSRIVTWIAAGSSLPLERDFYDQSGTLWKVERFEEVKDFDGLPTPLRLRMENKQEGGHTDIDVSDLRYDVDIPDSLFDPMRLREAAAWPGW